MWFATLDFNGIGNLLIGGSTAVTLVLGFVARHHKRNGRVTNAKLLKAQAKLEEKEAYIKDLETRLEQMATELALAKGKRK